MGCFLTETLAGFYCPLITNSMDRHAEGAESLTGVPFDNKQEQGAPLQHCVIFTQV